MGVAHCTWTPAPLPECGERIAVALSGGVDSAVVAHLLKERGCDLVGVTTRNFCFNDLALGADAAPKSCCSADALESARELCADLSIPHVVLDVAEEFRAGVIDDFIDEYRAGRTPNPCVRCNERVRFPSLLGWARRQGIARLATGHYAKLVYGADRSAFVARGVDGAKDQSYFLYRVPQAALQQLVLPLGDWHKEQVRELAQRRGLPMAQKPDSQEVCFVPAGGRHALVGNGAGPGEIVDRQGHVLGSHPGLTHFTVGQRRGLRLGGASTWYVTALDAPRNRVVVGPKSSLYLRELCCDEALLRDPLQGATGLVARTRYRHGGIAVEHVQVAGDHLHVLLVEPDRAPAPGQAVVLDRDGVIVGGGRLREDPCAS